MGEKTLYTKYFLCTLGFLVCILCCCFLFLSPRIAGDSISYVDSMHFIETGVRSSDFYPNRLITTFGGLELILCVSHVIHSIPIAWLSINIGFYFLAMFCFYRTLHIVFDDERIASIGTIILASNYAVISFGINYLMDMGGWAFYLGTLWAVTEYVFSGKRKYILIASAFVGIGSLFKEYAFLGTLIIATVLLWENWFSVKEIYKKSWLPSVIALSPIVILYAYIYHVFGYTYLDWLATNTERYESMSKIKEYIKVFGSLLNFSGFLVLIGGYMLLKQWSTLPVLVRRVVVAVLVSILPMFIWPGITQRVLFIAIPALTIVACFGIRELLKSYTYTYIIIVLVVFYIISNFTMDSFLLPNINLPL